MLTVFAGTRFHLRGFPASSKEKLLLIIPSQDVERRALATDSGTLRSSFQGLLRVNDNRGIQEAYERPGDSNVALASTGSPTTTS